MSEHTKLILYEGPKSLQDAGKEDLKSVPENQRSFALMHCTDTQIRVNGQDCYIYDTNVNHTRKWSDDYLPPVSRTPVACFDFEGTVKIQIIVPGREIHTVKVSPLIYGIEAEIDKDNSTVTFVITKPDNYTVTFNESPERAVHIFANSIDTEKYLTEDENVIYIGPGEWDMGTIMLKDGQTLYLAGGAVVHGVVNAEFAKDITVKGRGIIDGSHLPGWKGKDHHIPLKFDHCENVKIEDIIVLNANAWVCQGFDSKNGVIDGVRIISARPNGDGITLQSCENYEIKNCFVRTWDDSLVIKNYDRSSRNITFTNIQIWTDFAQSMEVGYETNKGNKENVSISHIKFEDITVLNNFHKPVISVHNADDAAVSDIIFRNIIVEYNLVGSGDGDEMPYLIDMNIAENPNWSTTKERGSISDIIVENVNVLAGNKPGSRMKGFDKEHKIRNVIIRNLEIAGYRIKDFESGKFEIDADTTADLRME